MATSRPISSAIGELNNLLLNQQEWKSRQKEKEAAQGMRNMMMQEQIKDMRLRREGLELQAAQAEYQSEMVPANIPDLYFDEENAFISEPDKGGTIPLDNMLKHYAGTDQYSVFQKKTLTDPQGNPIMMPRWQRNQKLSEIGAMYAVQIDPLKQQRSIIELADKALADKKAEYKSHSSRTIGGRGAINKQIHELESIKAQSQKNLASSAWRQGAYEQRENQLMELRNHLVGQQVKDLGWLDYQIGRNDKILTREAAKTKGTGKDSDFMLAYKDFRQRTGKDISIGQFRQQEWLKKTEPAPRDRNVRADRILRRINNKFFGQGGEVAANMRPGIRSEFNIKESFIIDKLIDNPDWSDAEMQKAANQEYNRIKNKYTKGLAAANKERNKKKRKENIARLKSIFEEQFQFVPKMKVGG